MLGCVTAGFIRSAYVTSDIGAPPMGMAPWHVWQLLASALDTSHGKMLAPPPLAAEDPAAPLDNSAADAGDGDGAVLFGLLALATFELDAGCDVVELAGADALAPAAPPG